VEQETNIDPQRVTIVQVHTTAVWQSGFQKTERIIT
jgi:hypothetical protein